MDPPLQLGWAVVSSHRLQNRVVCLAVWAEKVDKRLKRDLGRRRWVGGVTRSDGGVYEDQIHATKHARQVIYTPEQRETLRRSHLGCSATGPAEQRLRKEYTSKGWPSSDEPAVTYQALRRTQAKQDEAFSESAMLCRGSCRSRRLD